MASKSQNEERLESNAKFAIQRDESGGLAANGGVTRRSLLVTGAAAASAGAVAYSAPSVIFGQSAHAASVGSLPSLTQVSDSTPSPGQVVTFTGSNFHANPAAMCMTGFFPTGVNKGGGLGDLDELTAITANIPGTFNVGIGVGEAFDGWGALGAAHPTVTGMDFTQAGARGATIELDPADTVTTGVEVTIGAGSGTQLPVYLSGGEIKVDFSGFTWSGGEKLESEFHFNVSGGTSAHCDYFYSLAVVTSSGSSNACASLVGLQIVTAVAATNADCKDIDLDVSGGILSLFFPGGTVTSLHSRSHVVVT